MEIPVSSFASDSYFNAADEKLQTEMPVFPAKFTLEKIEGAPINPDVEILSSNNYFYARNKKTGYSFFAHFD